MDGHAPVPPPPPGCGFGKVGRGAPTAHPQYFPPTGFPRVSKMCLEHALSILTLGEGGCHLRAPIPGCGFFTALITGLSQAVGRAGPDDSQEKRERMLFSHRPSPQAGALLVVTDTKPSLFGERRHQWKREERLGVISFREVPPLTRTSLAPRVKVSCQERFFFFFNFVGER